MKNAGTFDDAALQAALAAELGKDAEYVRYVESLRRKVITAALREGKRVSVGGVGLHPVVKGPFESIDGEFDPKRNSVYIRVTPPKALRDALRKVVPERLDAPELSIGTVVTASLGARAYNAVKRGEPFVVTGSGFEEGMTASLSDGKGAAHPLVVESVRPNSLVCSFSAAVPKGAATLSVSVPDEETGRIRARATRKVKVA